MDCLGPSLADSCGRQRRPPEQNGSKHRRWTLRGTASSYDIIFMDCNMPLMDGYDATRAIHSARGGEHAPPIVAMTANVFAEDRRRCFDAGMDDFVAKPIDVGAVLNVLKRLGLTAEQAESSVAT
ncbi:MAG: response regulator [Planctomycetota bacterium]